MQCSNCGAPVMNGVQFCPNCGNPAMPSSNPNQTYQQGFPQQEYQQGNFQAQQGYYAQADVDAGIGLKILSFLIPLVGFIIFLQKRLPQPTYAYSCLQWGLIGLGVGDVWAIIKWFF